jgi:hypothetical protein
MNKEFIQEWVDALRSGEYKQIRGVMRAKDKTFCCIGVACHLKAKKTKKAFDKLRRDKHFSYEIAGEWLLPIEDQQKLTDLNDIQEKSFKEIADIIEDTYL